MLKINVTKVAHFNGHRDCIYALAPSLHDDCFYSGASEGFIVEWNTILKGDGKLIANIQKPVYCLHADTTKKQLLCGVSTGNLHVIDLIENKEIRNIEAHTLGLFDIKESNNHLLTCGGDGIIQIWNKNDLSLIHSIKASDKSARVIAISPDQQTIAVGFSDWLIRLYDLHTFQLKQVLEGHTNSVFALTFTPDGSYLLSGGRDAMLKVWDVQNRYAIIKDIPAHTLQIKCIAYSPNGKLFATTSMDKTIKIWDAVTFDLLKVIDKARNDAHTNSINKLLWKNDTQFLTCSDDRNVMMWEIN
jgi:WD40 repeat protein